MAGWRAMREAITADRRRLSEYRAAHAAESGSPPFLPFAFLAMLLHRVAHYLHANGWRMAARLVWLVNICVTGADIGPAGSIGKGTIIPYPRTVTIYGTVGEDCVFLGQCGIGGLLRPPLGLPVLGDGVVLAPGSLVLGPRTIGRRVHVGPRCIVTRDVPDDAVIVPDAWRSISRAADAGAAA